MTRKINLCLLKKDNKMLLGILFSLYCLLGIVQISTAQCVDVSAVPTTVCLSGGGSVTVNLPVTPLAGNINIINPGGYSWNILGTSTASADFGGSPSSTGPNPSLTINSIGVINIDLGTSNSDVVGEAGCTFGVITMHSISITVTMDPFTASPDITVTNADEIVTAGTDFREIVCSGTTPDITLADATGSITNFALQVTNTPTPTNLTNALTAGAQIAAGAWAGTEALTNANQFGTVTYEVTPYEDTNSNGMYDAATECAGEPIDLEIVIEPIPQVAAYVATMGAAVDDPIVLCANDINNGSDQTTTDVTYFLESPDIGAGGDDPSTHSYIEYRLVGSAVLGGSASAAGVAVTPSPATPYNNSMTTAAPLSQQIDLDITIGTPAALTTAATVALTYQAFVITPAGSADCTGGTHTVNISIEPYVDIDVSAYNTPPNNEGILGATIDFDNGVSPRLLDDILICGCNPMAAMTSDDAAVSYSLTLNTTGTPSGTSTAEFEVTGAPTLNGVTESGGTVIANAEIAAGGMLNFTFKNTTTDDQIVTVPMRAQVDDGGTDKCFSNPFNIDIVVEPIPSVQIDVDVKSDASNEIDNLNTDDVSLNNLISVCHGESLSLNLEQITAVTPSTGNLMLHEEITNAASISAGGVGSLAAGTRDININSATAVDYGMLTHGMTTCQTATIVYTPFIDNDGTAGFSAGDCKGNPVTLVINVEPSADLDAAATAATATDENTSTTPNVAGTTIGNIELCGGDITGTNPGTSDDKYKQFSITLTAPTGAATCSGNQIEYEIVDVVTPTGVLRASTATGTASIIPDQNIASTPTSTGALNAAGNITEIAAGGMLSEFLLNNSLTTQTVQYIVRPQIDDTGTDDGTETCIGTEYTIEVQLEPNPALLLDADVNTIDVDVAGTNDTDDDLDTDDVSAGNNSLEICSDDALNLNLTEGIYNYMTSSFSAGAVSNFQLQEIITNAGSVTSAGSESIAAATNENITGPRNFGAITNASSTCQTVTITYIPYIDIDGSNTFNTGDCEGNRVSLTLEVQAASDINDVASIATISSNLMSTGVENFATNGSRVIDNIALCGANARTDENQTGDDLYSLFEIDLIAPAGYTACTGTQLEYELVGVNIAGGTVTRDNMANGTGGTPATAAASDTNTPSGSGTDGINDDGTEVVAGGTFFDYLSNIGTTAATVTYTFRPQLDDNLANDNTESCFGTNFDIVTIIEPLPQVEVDVSHEGILQVNNASTALEMGEPDYTLNICSMESVQLDVDDLGITPTGGGGTIMIQEDIVITGTITGLTAGTRIITAGTAIGPVTLDNPTASSNATATITYTPYIDYDGNSMLTAAADCIGNDVVIEINVSNNIPEGMDDTSSPPLCSGSFLGYDLQNNVTTLGNGEPATFEWRATSIKGMNGAGAELLNNDPPTAADVAAINAVLTGITFTAPQNTTSINDQVSIINSTDAPYSIVYTVTPFSVPAGCEGTPFTVTFVIGDCGIMKADIIDPCLCLDNATTDIDGQFGEIIEVDAPSGQTWYIQSVTGLFDAGVQNSDGTAPANSDFTTGTQLANTLFAIGSTGVTLEEIANGDGTSKYYLAGHHIDSEGYLILVTNGTETLSISNTCFYPVITATISDDRLCTMQSSATIADLISTTIDAGDGSGTVAGTTTYDIDNAGTFAATTTTDLAALAVGTHTVTVRFDANDTGASFPGCVSANKTISIEVLALPTATDPAINICSIDQNPYDLTQHNTTVNATGTITWYDGQPSGTGTPIAAPTAVDLSAIDVWARVTDADGCVNEVDFTQTITPTPTTNAVTLYMCENGAGSNQASFMLTDAEDIATNANIGATAATDEVDAGATGVTVSYHISLADAMADQAPLSSPYLATDGTTLHVRVESTTNASCFATTMVTLETLTLPTAEAGNDVTICNGDNTVLNAGGSTGTGTLTYSWSDATTLSSATVANPTANPTATTTYTVTVTDDNGTTDTGDDCTSTDMVTVTVNPTPDGTLSAVDASICNGETVQLIFTSTVGTGPFNLTINATNYTNITSGTAFNVTSAYPTGSSLAGTTNAYTLTAITDANTCTNTTISTVANIMIFDIPTANAATLQVCETSMGSDQGVYTLTDAEDFSTTSNIGTATANEADNGATGVTVTYHISLADAMADQATLSSPYTANEGTVVYARVENTGNPDCFATTTVTLATFPTPIATAGTYEFCAEDLSTNLTIANPSPTGGTGPYTHSWTDVSGTGILVNTTESNEDAELEATATAGTYTVNYQATDANGCQSELIEVIVIINDEPDGNLLAPSFVCDGRSFTLMFQGTVGMAPHTIDVSGGTAANSTNIALINIAVGNATQVVATITPSLPNANTLVTETYSVTSITDANTCNGAAPFHSIMVGIIDLDPRFTIPDMTCATTGTTISLALTNPGNLTADQVVWYGGLNAGTSAGAVDDTGTGGTFTAAGATPGVYTICVDVIQGACSETYCQDIIVDMTPPTITTCPATQTLDLGTNCEVAVPNLVALATATDGTCSTPTITQSIAAGTMIGSDITVTLTATDEAGNTSTCDVLLHVQDVTVPTITCPATVNINLDSQCDFVLPNFTSSAVVADNCGIANITQSPIAGMTIATAGTTPVTLSITDDAGNAVQTCMFDVVVADGDGPTAICKNITVTLDGSGDATITAAQVDAGSFDNCVSPVNVSATPLAFDCTHIGTLQSVTLTATAGGLMDNCTALVTVLDQTAPVLTGCPADQTVMTGASATACSATATWTGPTFTDNCSTTISSSHVSGATFPLGQTTVVYTGVDPSGNATTCEFVITVEDNTVPTITCPADLTINLNSQCDLIMPNFTSSAVAADNCGIATITQTPLAGTTISTVGDQTVTLSVLDDEGNTATTCDFTVTVGDGDQPTAICKNITLVVDGSGAATITAAQVDAGSFDNCIAPVTLMAIPLAFDCDDIGTTQSVVLTATAGTMSDQCTALVTVLDQAAPTVPDCPTDITVMTGASATTCTAIATWTAPTFADNCSVTVSNSHTSGATFSLGQTTVAYRGVDPSGNATTCEFVVTVEDNTIPTITCPANKAATVNSSCNFVLPDYTGGIVVGDNCGTVNVLQSPAPGTVYRDAQTVAISITVTDNAGNTNTTCSFDLVLTDGDTPIALCQDITIQLDATGNASIAVADVSNSSAENCGIMSSVIDDTAFTCADIGNNQVTLTVTDDVGNVSTCIANVMVMDQMAPTFTCPTSPMTTSGCDGLIPNLLTGLGEVDECGGTVTLTQNPVAGTSIGSVGNMVNVTVTATDASGNASNCMVTIEVIDAAMPSFQYCPPVIEVNAFAGQCEAFAYWQAPVAVDNCSLMGAGSVTQTSGPSPGTLQVGDHEVTYTAMDADGNDAECTTMIKVIDKTPPTFATTLPLQTSAACDAIPDPFDFNPAWHAADNCTNVTHTLAETMIDVQCPNTFTLKREWTIMDESGNTATHIQKIFVEDAVNPTPICQNQTIALSGGTASITTTMIDNGSSDNCSTNLIFSLDKTTFDCDDAGSDHTVTLTVKDECNNTATCTAEVSIQGPKLNGLAITGTNVSCAGANDGAADLVVDGGRTPFTYGWSSGATTEDLTNLGPGTYSVTVTDANGCTTTASVEITEAQELDISIASTDITCSNGGYDGAINLTVNNGTTPYTYAWTTAATNGNGATTEDLTNIGLGTYMVRVTDNNGCSKEETVTVNAPDNCIDEVMIVDPCHCSNPLNVTLADGTLLLQDVVRILPSFGSTIVGASLTFHSGDLLDAAGNPLSQTASFTSRGGGEFGLDIFTISFMPATFSVDVTFSSGTVTNFSNLMTMSDCDCTTPSPTAYANNNPIPTLSEWGLIIIGLLIINLGFVFVYRQELASEGAVNISLSSVPFDKQSFIKYFAYALLALAIIFFIAMFISGYKLMTFDMPGSVITAALIAYMAQFIRNK